MARARTEPERREDRTRRDPDSIAAPESGLLMHDAARATAIGAVVTLVAYGVFSWMRRD